jgi:ADP-glucose pyrophosphorylase
MEQTMEIHKGARLRNLITGEDCIVVDGPDIRGRWAVVYEDDDRQRYWVRPGTLEPRT